MLVLSVDYYLINFLNAEAISIGPDMFDVHTPNEHVSIPSVANVWDYVIEILKSMNQY